MVALARLGRSKESVEQAARLLDGSAIGSSFSGPGPAPNDGSFWRNYRDDSRRMSDRGRAPKLRRKGKYGELNDRKSA